METLGDYVDLSRENLKMAVWSGDIELRNLNIKSNAFDKLDIPVNVLNGSLSSLRVAIPWKRLGETPVRVTLEGLYVLLGPSSDSMFTAEDLERHSTALRDKILERAEAIAYAYISAELSKKAAETVVEQDAVLSKKKKNKRFAWLATVGLSYAQRLIAKVTFIVKVVHFGDNFYIV